jgi:hypothetical protein
MGEWRFDAEILSCDLDSSSCSQVRVALNRVCLKFITSPNRTTPSQFTLCQIQLEVDFNLTMADDKKEPWKRGEEEDDEMDETVRFALLAPKPI